METILKKWSIASFTSMGAVRMSQLITDSNLLIESKSYMFVSP